MSHAAREDLVPPLKYLNCKKNNDNWISQKDGNSKFINQQTESPLLDRRLMALKYSETFKISSRAEASVVLKLTQQLSDSLEQYFLNCKGLEVLDSGLADNTTEMYDTSRKSVTERHDEPSQSMPVGFSSQSCSTTGPYYSSVSESNFKANTESKPHVVSSGLEIKTQSDLDMESNESDFDISSLHSSSSQETPSSSQAQRKTSKTLSPDILQLLKGKDANTVTNILKTLSPFYPALQDVNLEILAQVLVNTGALD